VKIVGNDFRMNIQDALEVLHGFAEKIVAFEIFEVADVLAEEGFIAADDADRVF